MIDRDLEIDILGNLRGDGGDEHARGERDAGDELHFRGGIIQKGRWKAEDVED
jgi:hypothetical protein